MGAPKVGRLKDGKLKERLAGVAGASSSAGLAAAGLGPELVSRSYSCRGRASRSIEHCVAGQDTKARGRHEERANSTAVAPSACRPGTHRGGKSMLKPAARAHRWVQRPQHGLHVGGGTVLLGLGGLLLSGLTGGDGARALRLFARSAQQRGTSLSHGRAPFRGGGKSADGARGRLLLIGVGRQGQRRAAHGAYSEACGQRQRAQASGQEWFLHMGVSQAKKGLGAKQPSRQ